MDPIKKTIRITKLDQPEDLSRDLYELLNKTVYRTIRLVSLRLDRIDPTDVVFNITFPVAGPVKDPTSVYLGDFGKEFISRDGDPSKYLGGYLEFYPGDNNQFIFTRPEDSRHISIWLSTYNKELKNPEFECTLNVIFEPVEAITRLKTE